MIILLVSLVSGQVFNIEFVESGIILEKDRRMRGNFLHGVKRWEINVISRSLTRWILSDDGWLKANTDGVVCQLFGIAIAEGLIRRDHQEVWVARFL